MTINTKTGEIGFAAHEGDLGSYSQWWKPRHEDLVEFAEDVQFWADVFSIRPEFEVGQHVKGIAFTDCFGKFHAETPNLIVTKATLTTGAGIKPYYRYVCEEINGRGYQEGAGHYFAPMV